MMRLILFFAFAFNYSAFAVDLCTAAVSREDANILIDELARFRVAIYDLRSDDKTLALAEYKRKLSEVASVLGAGVRAQVEQRAEELKGAVAGEKSRAIEKSKTILEREKSSITVSLDVLFSVDMAGKFTDINDEGFDERYDEGAGELISGEGVKWTHGDRFVAFRHAGNLWLYDTQKRKFLDIRQAEGTVQTGTQKIDGTFLKGTQKWVYERDGNIFVLDLSSNKTAGPFKGQFDASFSRNDLLISLTENKRVGSQPSAIYVLHNLKSGASIELGQYFGISKDGKKVVRSSPSLGLEIVDSESGVPIREIEGKANRTGGSDDIIDFKRGNSPYFLRLSDLKEISGDAEFLGMREFNHDQTRAWYVVSQTPVRKSTLRNLESGDSTSFEYTQSEISKDGRTLLLWNPNSPQSELVDFESMKSQKLERHYELFSHNSRWVYNRDQNYRYDFYDRKTGNKFHHYDFAGYYLDFVGQSDYVVSQNIATADKTVFLADLSQWTGTLHVQKIGEEVGKSSPNGRFIVTYRDGKITLLRSPL